MYQNRSRITNVIWATIILVAGFGLWRILPESLRRQIEPVAHAANFTVNTADDHNDGVCNAADCTLREAINAVNAGSGSDTISFNIPGSGVHTINLTSGLPILNKTVTIDGATQPGFSGTPLIELNGGGAGSVNRIILDGQNVVIKSLVINRFSLHGINIATGGGAVVRGCYIGTDATGTKYVGNGGDGIRISSGAGNLIGGTSGDARNVINGNFGSGIRITGGDALIQGNFIGLMSDGSAIDGGNFGAGIAINGGLATIGGMTSGAGNVIGGNLDIDLGGPPEKGFGIYIHGGGGSLVQGNFIGNVAGAGALPTVVGVFIDGAANNVIGGTSAAARNIISGSLTGIQITNGATDNVVQGNFIGPDITGSKIAPNFGSSGVGVSILAGNNNLIGGTTPGTRNVISVNGVGIAVVGGGATRIQGNFIGLNAAGTAGIANGFGISISGGSATVGGTEVGAGNVISGINVSSGGGPGAGVYIRGGAGSQVLGNFIGTNPAGKAKMGNRLGVMINGAANNVIGGTTIAERNIISGNTEIGVGILNTGATNNIVQGNFIGTDITGSNKLGNGDGVQIGARAQNNTIGGTATGAGNVISGNGGSGIAVTGGSGTSILGNIIGLNVSGTAPVGFFGNEIAGVLVSGGSATVGGTTPGARNIIAGNGVRLISAVRPTQVFESGVGVRISGGTGSQVVGNTIGPGNGTGVDIDEAANSVIGGTSSAERNIISGNDLGVGIFGATAKNNIVQGNLITQNGEGGVGISSGASNNKIGGTTAGAGNSIANNGFEFGFDGTFAAGPGVSVSSGTGNAILGNSISANGRLGIDLSPVFVTANDNCDSDTGPNNLQNFPVLTSAVTNSTTTTIQGILNSTANTQFRIEFFANTTCDPSGNGQGQTFLGFTNTTTDVSCNASFTFSVPNTSVTGPIITATATDANNNTSEFSACASPMGTLPTIQFSAPAYAIG